MHFNSNITWKGLAFDQCARGTAGTKPRFRYVDICNMLNRVDVFYYHDLYSYDAPYSSDGEAIRRDLAPTRIFYELESLRSSYYFLHYSCLLGTFT